MSYTFDEENLEEVFDMINKEYGGPVREGEVTASMMYAKDKSVTMRTHLNRLKRLVDKGLMTVRVAKQGELAFKRVKDGE